MRVDDRLITVVERAGGSSALRAVGWQQLVDLLSRRPDIDSEAVNFAYRALEKWRPDTTVDRRTRAVAAAADAQLPARLFSHLVRDEAEVAAPVLTRSRVADEVIIAELAHLSGPSRALLRHRKSVSDELARALDAYGPADRALTEERRRRGPPEAPLPKIVTASETARRVSTAPIPIRDLVERIDRFRLMRQTPVPTSPRAVVRHAVHVDHPMSFAIQTGRLGVIDWTDAPARAAVLGLSLAETGEGFGVGECVAKQFARRAAIGNGRLLISGNSSVSGEWRIDATAVFARTDGRFAGYVGQARRPGSGASTASSALTRSDAFRQIMHELMTPLNAVIGFAELIEEQLLGPLSDSYRDQAAQVRQAGHDVLGVLDDVRTAVRLDGGADPAPVCDDEGLVLNAAIAARLVEFGAGCPFELVLAEERLPAASSAAIRRIVDRLLSALAPLAASGERLPIAITGRKRARVRVRTPKVLRGVPLADLRALRFPQTFGHEVAPLLGLEFTLRFVRRLAEEVGGELSVSADEFILSLPVRRQKEATHLR